MDNKIYFIIIIIIICMIIIYYNTYKFKKNIENFMGSEEDNKDLYIKKNKISPLTSIGYINSNDFLNKNLDIYISDYEFHSYSMNDIYQKIIDDINLTLQKTAKEFIEETIYVYLIQDIQPKCNIDKDNQEILIGKEPILTTLIIIYPSYCYDGKKIIKDIDNIDINKFKTLIKSSNIDNINQELYMINKNDNLFKRFYTKKLY